MTICVNADAKEQLKLNTAVVEIRDGMTLHGEFDELLENGFMRLKQFSEVC